MSLEDAGRMFDVAKYEGYRFCRKGRWYYIENGKLVMPGSGREPVALDFVCALTREDMEEYSRDEDSDIARIAENYEGETAPLFILNHGAEPAEGLYLIVGYKEGRAFTNRTLRRKIDKMEKGKA
jgi:hypothetical protein